MRYRKPRETIFTLLAVFLACFFFLKPHDSFSEGKHAETGSYTLAITVDGLERTYIVHVPATYRPQAPSPVVIMLHGGGGTGIAAKRETGWAEKADKEGFLAVFPDAVARDPAKRSSFAGNPQLWNDGSGRFHPAQNAVDDVRFLDAMLDDLLARFNVDNKRIYVTGFSNGASMTFRLGTELSERIAAIAPVAGALWEKPQPLKRPVPMIYITGTDDTLNPIEGGVPRLATGRQMGGGKAKPPVRDSILRWTSMIGCPAEPRDLSESNGVLIEKYGLGGEGAEVVLVKVEGLGHQWAGGKSLLPEFMVGAGSDKINATSVIWEFFTTHTLSEKKDAQHVAPADADKPRR